jgi:Zn-dependent peptidase ImmA (M78 family)
VRGLWDLDQDTIFIGKWLPKRTQRRVLLHELIHACIDYRDLYD